MDRPGFAGFKALICCSLYLSFRMTASWRHTRQETVSFKWPSCGRVTTFNCFEGGEKRDSFHSRVDGGKGESNSPSVRNQEKFGSENNSRRIFGKLISAYSFCSRLNDSPR